MIGFAITRNVRRATTRNRVKRVLREAWRKIAPNVHEHCRKSRTKLELVILYTGGDERVKRSTKDIAANVTELAERLTARLQTKL